MTTRLLWPSHVNSREYTCTTAAVYTFSPHCASSRGVLEKMFLNGSFAKRPRVAHMFNHSRCRLAVGGWWRLAVGRLAVGGGWWLVVGGGW